MMAIGERRITAAEYFKLPETNTPIELINGVIIVSPTPFTTHQFVIANVYDLLKSLKLGGRIIFAPVELYLDEENVPQPDLIWIAQDRLSIIEPKHVRGASDLVLEVLSPSTAKRDKSEKFYLYEKYGVREYWIADPVAEYLEVWTLVEGAFKYIGAYGAGDTFASPLLGQMVDVTAIFPPAEPTQL
ncbi:MAG: Uma2 family endonuclease [Chloroflexi bacterium]|nr:Uma2 family endonuclease [Chloroflexota bacterium]